MAEKATILDYFRENQKVVGGMCCAVQVKRLSTLLSEDPLVSQNGRLYFFDIRDFKQRLEQSPSPEDRALFKSTMTVWGGGFSGLEGTPEANWRWSSSSGELILYNMADVSRTVSIKTTCFTGYEEPAELKITSPSFSDRLEVSNAGTPYSRDVTMPPGAYKIKFDCDGKRVYAPGDPRVLVFRLANFSLVE